MKAPFSTLSLKAWTYGLTWLGWVLYVEMTYFTPDTNSQFHLKLAELDLLRATIVIPMLIIWLISAHGVISFRAYTLQIKQSPDGQALGSVALGLMLLYAYLVLDAVLGATVPFFGKTTWLSTVILIHTHLPLVFAVIGAILIFQGSQGLARVVHEKTWTARRLILIFIPFCIFSAAFSWSFLNGEPSIPLSNGIPAYSAPVQVLMFSYVLPHLALWFLGLVATANIALYAQRSPGKLYRPAFLSLAHGILIILFFTIAIQALSITASSLVHLQLGKLLGLIYVLLILYATGFAWIDRAARRLNQIEVV